MTTEVKTRIKVEAEGSALKKMAQTIRETFAPNRISDFRKQAVGLEKDFSAVVKQQAALVEQLKGVKEGTEAYKELAAQLKSVKTQGDLLSQSLSRLDAAEARATRKKSQGFGRNFVAGFGQGSGLAQYIPTDPGMGGRMLGAGAAQAMRAGAAPFMTPGLGGLQQAVAGIPILGGFAAGALGSASGSYQSAVGWQQARMGNIPYMGREIGSVAVEELGGPERSLLPLELRQILAQAKADTAVKHRDVFEDADNDVKRAKDLQTALDAQAKEQKSKPKAMSRPVTDMPGTSRGLPGVDFGVDMGFTPTEVQAHLGQFAHAKGGRMQTYDMYRFQEALAAQRVYGVDAQTAGRFQRGGMAGGGGMSGQSLASVLQGATAMDLEGSQVVELLTTLVDLQTKAEREGMKVSMDEAMATAMSLNAAGLKGSQAGRITSGLVASAQKTGMHGVQDPMDLMWMRAAGYDPSGGLQSYEDARRKLSKNDAATRQNMIARLVEGSGGFGKPGAALSLVDRMGEAGMSIDFDQADALLKAFADGKTPDISSILSRQAAGGGMQDMIKSAKGLTGEVSPAARGAAELEAQRVGIGNEVAGIMKGMEANLIETGKLVGNFKDEISKLNGLVRYAIDTIVDFTKGGFGGMWEKIKAFFEELARKLVPTF